MLRGSYRTATITNICVTEFGSLTTSQLVEKVRGLQELAFQLGLEEGVCLLAFHFLMNMLGLSISKL